MMARATTKCARTQQIIALNSDGMEQAEKAWNTLKYKTGFGNKLYSDGLTGNSLQDLMRIATAKTLQEPDPALNQEVG